MQINLSSNKNKSFFCIIEVAGLRTADSGLIHTLLPLQQSGQNYDLSLQYMQPLIHL